MIRFATKFPSYLPNNWRKIFFHFELCNPITLSNMPERRALYSAPSFVTSSRCSKATETSRPSEHQRFHGFLLILNQSGLPDFSLEQPDRMLLLLLISPNHWNTFFNLLILIMRLHFYLFLHQPLIVIRATPCNIAILISSVWFMPCSFFPHFRNCGSFNIANSS